MKRPFATLVVLLIASTAQAQPWPAADPGASGRLDDLLAAATRARAVEPLPATEAKTPASYRLADPAGLKAVLRARKDALGDDVCDACVLRWRDGSAAQKGFWVQWLRGIGEATGRPRPSGLADLLEAATLPGDPAAQARAPILQASARDHFRAAKDVAWEAASENEMGLHALGKDQFEEADARFEAAVALYTKAFHPRHRLVASTLRNRGNGPAKRQDFATAVRFYRQAADLLDASDPGSAAERVSILQNLASAYFGQGDMTSAIGPIREAIETLTRLRGPNDPGILPFLETLGNIYFSRSEHEKALETAKRASDLARAAFAPGDPRLARPIRTFADRLGRVGKTQEAIEGHREAFAILEKSGVTGGLDLAGLRESIAEDLARLNDPEGAIREYRATIDLYRREGSRLARLKAALAVTALASAQDSLGRVKEAGESFRRAIADLSASTDSSHPILLVIRESYGLHLLQHGEHSQAADQYKQGHDLAKKLGRDVDQAMQAERLAHAYQLADEQDKALAAVNEAIAILRKTQHPKLANSYSTLAAIHRSKGETEEARRYDRLAYDSLKTIANPDDPSVLALGSLVARNLQQVGDFGGAEAMLRDTADTWLRRVGPKAPDYGQALVDLAQCQAASGRPAIAEKTLDEALAVLRDSAMPRRLVSALMEKSRIQNRLGRKEPAVKALREALDIVTKSGLAGGEIHAQVLSELGEAARTAGDPRLAAESYESAFAIYRSQKASLRPVALSCIKSLVEIRSEIDGPKAGLESVDRGLAELVAGGDPGHPTYLAREATVDLLNTRAEFLLRVDGNATATWKKAYESLATASGLADRIRGEQLTTAEAKQRLYDVSRYESVILRLTLCEMLAGAEPGAGWLGEAFRTSEESKARVFLEQLGRSRSAVIGGLPDALATREAELRDRLAKLDREIGRIEVAPFDGRQPALAADTLGRIAEAERAMEELQSRIAREYPVVASLRRSNPCTVEQARACLGPNEVALIYSCGARVGDIVLVRPPSAADPVGLSLIPIGGMTDFGDALGVLADPDALQVRELYERSAADLHRMLIGPVQDQIRGKDLVIVPDGPLGLLNFEILRDPDGKFLVETRRIRYAPSMTALHLNRLWESRRSRPVRPFLGIGDPVYTPDDPRLEGRPLPESARATLDALGEPLPRLSSASFEVRETGRIAGALPEDLWIGPAATEARLKDASSRGRLLEYRFVHFATHGRLGSGPDRPAALLLSLTDAGNVADSAADEGVLQIAEASTLKLDADLVVLSGCHTARGDLALGEGVTGLARAFLVAGSRGVVCSLWALDDIEAAENMRRFYRSIVAGQPPAEALRQAKLAFIREGQPPSRWAPLILIGQ